MSNDGRRFLLDRSNQLAEAFDKLTFELPRGIVHGDASVGNVIRDRYGNPLLADLDGFAIGPREWDLVLTALYHENFGWHSRGVPNLCRYVRVRRDGVARVSGAAGCARILDGGVAVAEGQPVDRDPGLQASIRNEEAPATEPHVA